MVRIGNGRAVFGNHAILTAVAYLLLAACASQPRAIPRGPEAVPPIGAVQFCVEHPEHERCRG